jgi:hypothetical protein
LVTPTVSFKLLFRIQDMKLVDVHVLGELATELVHIGMMAMIGGATVASFDEACFNLPTLGALYKSSSYDAAFKVYRAGSHLSDDYRERPSSVPALNEEGGSTCRPPQFRSVEDA